MRRLNVKSVTYLASIALSMHSINAQAAKTIESCQDKMKDNIEYSRCLDGVIEVADRELQTWVNNQVFILEELAMNTGRKSALSMFRRSQTNFIKFREDNCRWQYLAVSPHPNSGPVYKKCYIRATKDRIKELNLINTNI